MSYTVNVLLYSLPHSQLPWGDVILHLSLLRNEGRPSERPLVPGLVLLRRTQVHHRKRPLPVGVQAVDHAHRWGGQACGRGLVWPHLPQLYDMLSTVCNTCICVCVYENKQVQVQINKMARIWTFSVTYSTPTTLCIVYILYICQTDVPYLSWNMHNHHYWQCLLLAN